MANVVVRFLRGHSPYQAGEAAGFPADVAAAYVRAGVARYVESEAEGDEDVDAADGGDVLTADAIADMHHATAAKRVAECDDVELVREVADADTRASVVQAAKKRLEVLTGGGDGETAGDDGETAGDDGAEGHGPGTD